MKLFELTGQTAVVTGAATGIGQAIACRLAEAGADIAVADINFEGAAQTAGEIATATGRQAFPVTVDISDSTSVNAGIAGRAAPLWEQTDHDWRQVIAVNLNGVFHCCRAVISHMRERRYGRIVNIASIAGKEGNPNMAGYSATKAAVIAFTKSLAKEVATEGICVNSVAPAVVRTRILDQLSPTQIEYMTQRIPMRRTGRPEEIAAVVHFLASPDCSFVTGQCYDASGGRATY
jgi:NAD(P)-dependent dehydrogenase (short-subunit alcohol dehydrogenase family)